MLGSDSCWLLVYVHIIKNSTSLAHWKHKRSVKGSVWNTIQGSHMISSYSFLPFRGTLQCKVEVWRKKQKLELLVCFENLLYELEHLGTREHGQCDFEGNAPLTYVPRLRESWYDCDTKWLVMIDNELILWSIFQLHNAFTVSQHIVPSYVITAFTSGKPCDCNLDI